MMTESDRNTADLDALFQAARQSGGIPDDLLRRVLLDADQVQAGFGESAALVQSPGRWRQLLTVLGGWPAVGGLAAACAVGVWIGLAPPAFLPDPVQAMMLLVSDPTLLDGGDLAAALSEEG